MWQGCVILILLILPALLSIVWHSPPKDLLFFFAALIPALLGIITAPQIYSALTHPIILGSLGLYFLLKTFRKSSLSFPWALFLEMLSAILFFYAIQACKLDQTGASLLKEIPQKTWLALSFPLSFASSYFLPPPIAFSVLYSIAGAHFANDSHSLFLATVGLAGGTLIYKITNFKKWITL